MEQNKSIGTLLVLLAGSMWGLAGIFVRILGELGLTTMEIVACRAALSLLMLWPIVAVYDRRLLKVHWRDLWIFLITGALSVTFYCYFYYCAMEITSLAVAAILVYTAPMIVTLFSALMFKEALTKRKLLACALAFGGCVLVAGVSGADGRVPALGVGFGLTAAFLYASYSLFSRVALNRHYHPLTISAYTFLFALIAALPLVRPAIIAAKLAAAPAIGGWCLLSAFSTSLLPIILYTIAMTRVETGQASIMASVEPVVATVISVTVFQEALGATRFCGILLVLLAIVLLNLKPLTHRIPHTHKA